MHKTASKGAAIKELQRIFNFTFEESMSFGDFLNDVEMLKKLTSVMRWIMLILRSNNWRVFMLQVIMIKA